MHSPPCLLDLECSGTQVPLLAAENNALWDGPPNLGQAALTMLRALLAGMCKNDGSFELLSLAATLCIGIVKMVAST